MSINGFDVDALGTTIAAVADDKKLGKVTFAVQGEWKGGLALDAMTGPLTQGGQADESRRGRFTMSSDEPLALLGGDSATSPAEYLLQALAGCYTVTLVANAAARGIELHEYRLALEADIDLSGFLGIDDDVAPGAQQIRVSIDLDAPGASREELTDLVETVERRSPIRDTLVRPVEVVTTLR